MASCLAKPPKIPDGCTLIALQQEVEADNQALDDALGFPLFVEGERLGWLLNLDEVRKATKLDMVASTTLATSPAL